MANRGAQPRVRAGHEAAETLHHLRVQVVVETLHGNHVHGRPSLRLIGVERHPITEFVQCDGQRRGRGPLLLVDGLAESSCLSR